MILRPSGDQWGSAQPADPGVPFGRPQPIRDGSGIGRRSLPSAWTSHSELWMSGLRRRERTISLPCGDQLPVELAIVPLVSYDGVIARRPVPSVLTVNMLGPPR